MSDTLLTHRFFTPLVGVSFAVTAGDAMIEMRLREATLLPPSRLRRASGEVVATPEAFVRQEPFSLLFLGPPDRLLPQGIYRMTATEMGERPLDIFIVPIAREDAGFVYQAIFA